MVEQVTMLLKEPSRPDQHASITIMIGTFITTSINIQDYGNDDDHDDYHEHHVDDDEHDDKKDHDHDQGHDHDNDDHDHDDHNDS